MKKIIIFFLVFMVFVIFAPSIWGGGSSVSYTYTIRNKTSSKLWVKVSSEEHGYTYAWISPGVPGRWDLTMQFKPEHIEASEQTWPHRKLAQKLTGYQCAEIVISCKLRGSPDQNPLQLSEKSMLCP